MAEPTDMTDIVIQDPTKPLAYARGITIPTGRKPVSTADLVACFQTVMALDYDGEDETKTGLTMGDAAAVSQMRKAADGDLDAYKFIVERVGGKAVQQVQNFNVNASLKDFLTALINEDNPPPPAVDPFGD